MKKYISYALIAAFGFVVSPAVAELPETTRVKHFNIEKKTRLGLHGFDPVSYHKNGPEEGAKAHTLVHAGVRYHFASAENLAEFQANPQKYEPMYGGWCAWAMREGGKTDVDPKTFKLVDGKLYVFYNGLFGNTLKSWNKEAGKASDAQLVAEADTQWDKITG